MWRQGAVHRIDVEDVRLPVSARMVRIFANIKRSVYRSRFVMRINQVVCAIFLDRPHEFVGDDDA